MDAREARDWLDKQMQKQVDVHKRYWKDKIDKCKSLTELSIVAEDLIEAVDADYNLWIKKIESAETMTQMEIVCDGLMEAW